MITILPNNHNDIHLLWGIRYFNKHQNFSAETPDPAVYPNYPSYDYDGYSNEYPSEEHDVCSGMVEKHNICDLRDFPIKPLTQIDEFKNVDEQNFCCTMHAYVAVDECEVVILLKFPKIFPVSNFIDTSFFVSNAILTYFHIQNRNDTFGRKVCASSSVPTHVYQHSTFECPWNCKKFDGIYKTDFSIDKVSGKIMMKHNTVIKLQFQGHKKVEC